MKRHHIGINVRDLNLSKKFYEDAFGFVVERELQLGDEKIIFLKMASVRIELIRFEGNISYQGSHVHFAWEVDDLSAWIKRLGKIGIHPVEGPYDLKIGMKTVFFVGPDQESIELIENIHQ